ADRLQRRASQAKWTDSVACNWTLSAFHFPSRVGDMTTANDHIPAPYVPAPALRVAADKLAPAAMRAMSALDRATAQSSLEAGLKELVRARASQINGCAYCVETHTSDALKAGDTQRRLFLLPVWRETGLFTARE